MRGKSLARCRLRRHLQHGCDQEHFLIKVDVLEVLFVGGRSGLGNDVVVLAVDDQSGMLMLAKDRSGTTLSCGQTPAFIKSVSNILSSEIFAPRSLDHHTTLRFQ